MNNLFEAAFVIARRDFVATVYSRSFILFLLVPLVIFGAALLVGRAAEGGDGVGARPEVAIVTDRVTFEALRDARERLAAGSSPRLFPELRPVPPAENVLVQAQRLLADEEAGFSAVLAGTVERPVLIGPTKVDQSVGRPMELLLEEARRTAALRSAGIETAEVAVERVVTAQAAGNLQMIRRGIAQSAQGLIFMVTVLLATLLLSNMAEEKSNKVIEVLAAAVPLDAVFLGKLVAMLGVSLVGLGLWGGMLGLAYLFVQVLQDWMTVPDVGPAVGWPAFLILLIIYYTTNYMLLGALFLGIGGQASNIREIQTLSMPVTLLQVLVFFLAMSAVGNPGGLSMWIAYILPFSSPLAMLAFAAENDALWPHLVALVWQALWIVLIIRLSARLFRLTVLKSSPGGAFFSLAALRGKATE